MHLADKLNKLYAVQLKYVLNISVL